MSDIHIILCPECGKERFYKYKSDVATAIRKKSLCRVCAKKGERNPHYGKTTSNKQKQAIRNHNYKRWSNPDEIKKQSLYMKQHNPMDNPEYRRKISEANKGKSPTKEVRKRISDTLKEFNKNNPEFARRRSEENKRYFREHPEVVKRMTVHVKKARVQKKIAKSVKELWKNPEYYQKACKIRRDLWHNKEYQEKIKQSRQMKPNKFEVMFAKTFPELTYVGDFSFFVGSKNPDFIIEGTNKCIDLFGDYWHTTDESEQRKKYFAEHGMDLMIIWASEWYDDPESTFGKMNEYIGPEEIICL